jgi:predicted nucleic acid-binding Zn ribbon protein
VSDSDDQAPRDRDIWGGTDEQGKRDIHKVDSGQGQISTLLSPELPPLSPENCGQSGEPQDLAAGALEAARSIATGRRTDGSVADPGRPGRSVRRRRRRNPDGPSYSGPRPDERDPVRLGAIVGKALPELGWMAPLAEARLMTQWASVVGGEIAARCQPVSLVDGNLKVAAESTAWATQLRMMAPQILARITAELPKGLVNRIVITGPSGPSWKHGPWSVRGRGIRDTYG